MTRSHAPLCALLFAALLAGSDAHAQISASPPVDILKNAREMEQSGTMRDEVNLLRQGALFSNATATTRHDELESFFRRLPGRFRIGGNIEETMGYYKNTGEISGVADCRAVGEGLGVDCIINATWSDIDRGVARIGSMESPSERLKTFRPAVLVLGYDEQSMRVQSLLVTAASIAHGGVGRLDGNSVRLNHVGGDCTKDCFDHIRVTAEPGEVVTLQLRNISINITLTMHRDADAKASKKLKSLKSR